MVALAVRVDEVGDETQLLLLVEAEALEEDQHEAVAAAAVVVEAEVVKEGAEAEKLTRLTNLVLQHPNTSCCESFITFPNVHLMSW